MKSRFTELVNYLKKQARPLGVAPESFDPWVESCKAVPGGKNFTERGMHYLNFHYSGVLYVSGMPQAQIMLLVMLIEAWLDEKDDLRSRYNLNPPEYEIIELDNNRADVEITIKFIDDLYLVEMENGPLTICGKKYGPGEFDLWVAESAAVGHEKT